MAHDECVRRVMAAAAAESEAINLDNGNRRAEAIPKYEQSIIEFEAAIAAALPDHSDDRPRLIEHKAQVEARIATLKASPDTTIPVAQQIKSVQLAMAGAAPAAAASSDSAASGGVKTMAAVAAMGAVGGALVLGSTVGLTAIGAVGGAAGAAYCTTRNDGVGQAARTAGGVALSGVAKAQQINEHHQITAKAADAGAKTVEKAKAINEKHQFTSRISGVVGAAVNKGREIDQKHNVTSKLAGGLAKGLDGVSSLMGGSRSSASGATSAGYSAGAPSGGR